jgi:hypothetical protein
VRAALKREVAALLEGHGYPNVLASDKTARYRELEPPLAAVVSPVIEGHRYGGASLTAVIEIVAEPVQTFMESVPVLGLARTPRSDETLTYFLDLTSVGSLLTNGKDLDFQWQVEDESGISDALAELGSAIEGPLEGWVAERHSVTGVLEAQLGRPTVSGFSGRACAVLALQAGQPDVAQELVSRMASSRRSTNDSLQRLSVFQATLVQHFPDYQPADIPVAKE